MSVGWVVYYRCPSPVARPPRVQGDSLLLSTELATVVELCGHFESWGGCRWLECQARSFPLWPLFPLQVSACSLLTLSSVEELRFWEKLITYSSAPL